MKKAFKPRSKARSRISKGVIRAPSHVAVRPAVDPDRPRYQKRVPFIASISEVSSLLGAWAGAGTARHAPQIDPPCSAHQVHAGGRSDHEVHRDGLNGGGVPTARGAGQWRTSSVDAAVQVAHHDKVAKEATASITTFLAGWPAALVG